MHAKSHVHITDNHIDIVYIIIQVDATSTYYYDYNIPTKLEPLEPGCILRLTSSLAGAAMALPQDMQEHGKLGM